MRNNAIPTPPTYEQRLDLDENGTTDKISVADLDSDGPDLDSDKWTWDMNNNGDTQAIYQFGTDSAGDRQATIYGDLNTYAQNQALDATELLYPAARLHDWSGDGNYLEGSPFLGGYCQRDWFEDQMVGADNVYHDQPFDQGGSNGVWKDMKLDDYMDHVSWNFDLDGDGDMDIEHWIVRDQASVYRTRMDGWNRVHADLGDNNLASGIILDPTTGYVKMFIQENYQEINQNAGGWWGTHNYYQDRPYPGQSIEGMYIADGHDFPQSWFDSDGDGFCNARIYAEMPLHSGESYPRRYADGSFDLRVMRMVFRLNRDFNPDILKPMNTSATAGSALKWDGQILVMTLPRMVNGTEFWGRPWPATPAVYTDPWGHSLKILAVSCPLNWSGGRANYTVKSDGTYEMMEPEQSLWSFAFNRDWHQYRMGFFENPGHQNRQAPETLETGHRTEFNNDASGKPLGFYYSPLFGRVHLYGAEAGQYNHPTAASTPNTKLHFWDRNNTQMFDTYMVDGGTFGSPDGIFDKRMWYENGSVTIVQGSSAIAFPYTLVAPRADFNLNQTADWGTLQAAAEPFRAQYNSSSSSGFLINKGAGLFGQVTSNGSTWSGAPAGAVVTANPFPKIGFDTYHANNDINYGLLPQSGGNSYSVFASLLQSEKLTLEKVNATFTAAVLNNYKALVIPYLNIALSQAEKDALNAWVNAGGILYLINANAAAGDIANFTAAAIFFGFTPGSSYAVAWNNWESSALISHYTCFEPALLAGTPWIYSGGARLSGAGAALMSYDGQAIIMERLLGSGRVIALGTPDFTRDKMLGGPRQWYDRAFNDSNVPADAHYTAAVHYDKIVRGLIQRIQNGGVQRQNPDYNHDCAVDLFDLAQVAVNWLQAGIGLLGDINGDHNVDGLDLAELAAVWTGPDLVAPTVPTGLAAANIHDNNLSLSWNAASDWFCVSGYKVYRNGALQGQAGSPSYDESGLTQLTSYSYQVSALDGAGHESARSTPPLVVTTTAPPPSNLLDPTANPGFEAENPAGEANLWQDRGSYQSRATDFAHGGAAALKIANPGGNNYSFSWGIKGSGGTVALRNVLEAGVNYRLSGYIKTSGVTGAGARFRIYGGTGMETAFVTGTQNWTWVSVDFAGPVLGTDMAEWRIDCEWQFTTGTAWFDDLVLEER